MLGRIDYDNAETIEFKRGVNTSYICPKNGYIRWDSISVNVNTTYNITINGKNVRTSANNGSSSADVFYPVSEGDILSTTYSWPTTFSGSIYFMFYPQKNN